MIIVNNVYERPILYYSKLTCGSVWYSMIGKTVCLSQLNVWVALEKQQPTHLEC